MLADCFRVAPYRGRRPNGVSRLVARLTRRASCSPWMRSVTADTQVLGARRVVHEMRASVFVLPCCCSIFSGHGTGMDGPSKVDVCSSPTALSAALAVIAPGVMVSGAEGLTDERELARTVFRAALILCPPRCLSRRATCLWLLYLHDGLLLC